MFSLTGKPKTLPSYLKSHPAVHFDRIAAGRQRPLRRAVKKDNDSDDKSLISAKEPQLQSPNPPSIIEHDEEEKTVQPKQESVKFSNLRASPLSCGVSSATSGYELPSPAVAARNIVEQVAFAQLCTVMSKKHHKRAGYPFGTLADFVVDGSGVPIIRLSSLALPTRNVMENSHCSIVVQMPGWSDLTNARVTFFGDMYRLPMDMTQTARQLFLGRFTTEQNILTENLVYFRMHEIKDIFFVGGFGTVQWIEVEDYMKATPDSIVTSCSPAEIQTLNTRFADRIRLLLSRKQPIHEVEIISVDAVGCDVRTRTGGEHGVVRLGFQKSVASLDEVKAEFDSLFARSQPKRKN